MTVTRPDRLVMVAGFEAFSPFVGMPLWCVIFDGPNLNCGFSSGKFLKRIEEKSNCSPSVIETTIDEETPKELGVYWG
jgi:hypothetical protein